MLPGVATGWVCGKEWVFALFRHLTPLVNFVIAKKCGKGWHTVFAILPALIGPFKEKQNEMNEMFGQYK